MKPKPPKILDRMANEDDPTRKPKSHQAVADDMGMCMKDPHTRVVVAAFYWRACALYWRHKAKELPAS